MVTLSPLGQQRTQTLLETVHQVIITSFHGVIAVAAVGGRREVARPSADRVCRHAGWSGSIRLDGILFGPVILAVTMAVFRMFREEMSVREAA